MSLDDLVDDRDRVVTCLPIIQEVLQGFDDDRAYDIARMAMYAVPCLDSPLTDAVVDRAVDIYRRARRAGVTVRSGIDCLIAASAVRHGATIVHRDRDYTQIARVVSLQHQNIASRVARRAPHG